MKNKKTKKFNFIVGIFTITGVLIAFIGIIINVIMGSCQNSNSQEVINSGSVENFNQYNANGDIIVATHYYDAGESSSIDFAENYLYQKLKDEVNDKILCFIAEDFDNNGKYEAIAFVGEQVDENTWNGYPYFVNEKTVYMIGSKYHTDTIMYSGYYWNTYKEVKLGDNKAVVFTAKYISGLTDEIYGLMNGECVRFPLPYYNGSLNTIDNFITLTVDEYDYYLLYNNGPTKLDDESLLWTGHTRKPYYFFWNEGTNDFSEYGGVEITINQLYKLKDASKLIQEYADRGYDLLNILYRANGIINLNFEHKSDLGKTYENLTLYIKYQNSTIIMEDEIIDRNEGIYLKAVNPSIAVYPEFPIE